MLGVDAVERVALRAEFAHHLDLVVTRGQRGFHLVAPERTQHRADPFAAAAAAERQRARFEQARGLFVVQAKQQRFGRGGQQFVDAQRRGQLQYAVPGVLVDIRGVATLVGHLLQHQADRLCRTGGQQESGGQLFGLPEIVLQRCGQAGVAQLDQALVALATLDVAHGDRHHCLSQIVQRQQLGQRLVPARQPAQATGIVALGEQQAQRRRALQLDRQRAIELDVAGEQRAGHQRLAQQCPQCRRIVGTAGHLAP